MGIDEVESRPSPADSPLPWLRWGVFWTVLLSLIWGALFAAYWQYSHLLESLTRAGEVELSGFSLVWTHIWPGAMFCTLGEIFSIGVLQQQIRRLRDREARYAFLNERFYEKSARLHDLFVHTSADFWRWNLNTGELSTDLELKTLDKQGFPPLADALHPEEKLHLYELLNLARRGILTIFHEELRLRTLAGNYIWIELYGYTSHQNQDGSAAMIVGSVTNIHRRKCVELGLHESEKRYQDESRRLSEVIWATGVGTWEWDISSDQINVNPRWAQMLGYRSETLQSLSWQTLRDLCHPADQAQLDTALERCFKRLSEFYECEIRMRCDSGEWLWVLVRGRIAEWSERGQPLRMCGTQMDISIRKQVARRLAASEYYQRRLLEFLPVAITVHDANGCLISANGLARQWLGVVEGEHWSQLCRQLFTDAEQPVADTMFAPQQALQTGRSVVGQHLLCQHGAQPLWLSLSALPLAATDLTHYPQDDSEDGGGKSSAPHVAQVLTAWADITAIENSRNGLQLAASVFSHSCEGIAVLDRQWQYLQVNQAFETITGWGIAELEGLRAFRQLPSPQYDYIAGEVAEEVERNGFWSGQLKINHRDGRAVEILLSLSCVRDTQGRIQNYVMLISDISELTAQKNALEVMASNDPLTGLPNRRLLSERLTQACARSRRQNYSVAVIFIDLDGFKSVNDRCGHAGGDELLTTLAGRLLGALREGDTLARIGGDEFVAVLDGLEQASDCLPAIARLLQAAAEPVMIGERQVQVSASLGITVFPNDDCAPEQLLQHADVAMYEAKAMGKNCYQMYTDDNVQLSAGEGW